MSDNVHYGDHYSGVTVKRKLSRFGGFFAPCERVVDTQDLASPTMSAGSLDSPSLTKSPPLTSVTGADAFRFAGSQTPISLGQAGAALASDAFDVPCSGPQFAPRERSATQVLSTVCRSNGLNIYASNAPLATSMEGSRVHLPQLSSVSANFGPATGFEAQTDTTRQPEDSRSATPRVLPRVPSRNFVPPTALDATPTRLTVREIPEFVPRQAPVVNRPTQPTYPPPVQPVIPPQRNASVTLPHQPLPPWPSTEHTSTHIPHVTSNGPQLNRRLSHPILPSAVVNRPPINLPPPAPPREPVFWLPHERLPPGRTAASTPRQGAYTPEPHVSGTQHSYSQPIHGSSQTSGNSSSGYPPRARTATSHAYTPHAYTEPTPPAAPRLPSPIPVFVPNSRPARSPNTATKPQLTRSPSFVRAMQNAGIPTAALPWTESVPDVKASSEVDHGDVTVRQDHVKSVAQSSSGGRLPASLSTVARTLRPTESRRDLSASVTVDSRAVSPSAFQSANARRTERMPTSSGDRFVVPSIFVKDVPLPDSASSINRLSVVSPAPATIPAREPAVMGNYIAGPEPDLSHLSSQSMDAVSRACALAAAAFSTNYSGSGSTLGLTLPSSSAPAKGESEISRTPCKKASLPHTTHQYQNDRQPPERDMPARLPLTGSGSSAALGSRSSSQQVALAAAAPLPASMSSVASSSKNPTTGLSHSSDLRAIESLPQTIPTRSSTPAVSVASSVVSPEALPIDELYDSLYATGMFDSSDSPIFSLACSPRDNDSAPAGHPGSPPLVPDRATEPIAPRRASATIRAQVLADLLRAPANDARAPRSEPSGSPRILEDSGLLELCAEDAREVLTPDDFGAYVSRFERSPSVHASPLINNSEREPEAAEEPVQEYDNDLDDLRSQCGNMDGEADDSDEDEVLDFLDRAGTKAGSAVNFLPETSPVVEVAMRNGPSGEALVIPGDHIGSRHSSLPEVISNEQDNAADGRSYASNSGNLAAHASATENTAYSHVATPTVTDNRKYGVAVDVVSTKTGDGRVAPARTQDPGSVDNSFAREAVAPPLRILSSQAAVRAVLEPAVIATPVPAASSRIAEEIRATPELTEGDVSSPEDSPFAGAPILSFSPEDYDVFLEKLPAHAGPPAKAGLPPLDTWDDVCKEMKFLCEQLGVAVPAF